MAGDTFTVIRTGHVGAPPATVYELVSDFHQWPRWSPWEDLDPDMERTHSGAGAGPGAVYEWSGNRRAGAGRMEIVGAQPPTDGPGSVDIALRFTRPFRADNRTRFELAPDASGTQVSWSMTGTRPLPMRLLGFVFNMDKLVGKDFEKGLTRLDAAARA
jgi:uncharacterized protein YndB with AHSA1/START domain